LSSDLDTRTQPSVPPLGRNVSCPSPTFAKCPSQSTHQSQVITAKSLRNSILKPNFKSLLFVLWLGYSDSTLSATPRSEYVLPQTHVCQVPEPEYPQSQVIIAKSIRNLIFEQIFGKFSSFVTTIEVLEVPNDD
jgi:hypothetical protein